MTILQIAQGHGPSLDGLTRDEAVRQLTVADAEFLVKFPQCVPYHQPAWQELEANDGDTAPWGHEWYQVVDGVLQMHSSDYDSSD